MANFGKFLGRILGSGTADDATRAAGSAVAPEAAAMAPAAEAAAPAAAPLASTPPPLRSSAGMPGRPKPPIHGLDPVPEPGATPMPGAAPDPTMGPPAPPADLAGPGPAGPMPPSMPEPPEWIHTPGVDPGPAQPRRRPQPLPGSKDGADIAEMFDVSDAIFTTRAKIYKGENNVLVPKFLELFKDPASTIEDFTSVLSNTPSDAAVEHLVSAVERGPMDFIRAYSSKVTPEQVEQVLSKTPATRELKSSFAPIDDRRFALAHMRTQFVQDIINKSLVYTKGDFGTLSPFEFEEELYKYGRQRFARVMGDKGLTWDLLQDLNKYTKVIWEKPAGGVGSNVMELRNAGSMATVAGGVAGVPGAVAATVAGGGVHGLQRVGSAILSGGAVIGLPYGLSRLLGSKTYIKHMINVAEYLANPEAQRAFRARLANKSALAGMGYSNLQKIKNQTYAHPPEQVAVINELNRIVNMDENGNPPRNATPPNRGASMPIEGR